YASRSLHDALPSSVTVLIKGNRVWQHTVGGKIQVGRTLRTTPLVTVILVTEGCRHVATKFEPGCGIDIHRELTGITLVILTQYRASLIEISKRAVSLHFVRTTTRIYGVIMRYPGFHHQAGPVGCRHQTTIPRTILPTFGYIGPSYGVATKNALICLFGGLIWVSIGIIGWQSPVSIPPELDIFGCIHHFHAVLQVFDGRNSLVIERQSAFRASFGRYHDYPVRPARSVYRRGRSVL